MRTLSTLLRPAAAVLLAGGLACAAVWAYREDEASRAAFEEVRAESDRLEVLLVAARWRGDEKARLARVLVEDKLSLAAVAARFRALDEMEPRTIQQWDPADAGRSVEELAVRNVVTYVEVYLKGLRENETGRALSSQPSAEILDRVRLQAREEIRRLRSTDLVGK